MFDRRRRVRPGFRQAQAGPGRPARRASGWRHRPLLSRHRRPEAPREAGLKLLDTVAHVPTSSFKTFELLLPCSGTMSIEIVAEEDNYLSVFLVAPEELAKMKARQTFAHLEGFDGNLSAKYRRSARLSPGRYCLVLMDKSPGRLNASRADAQISVRLTDLK